MEGSERSQDIREEPISPENCEALMNEAVRLLESKDPANVSTSFAITGRVIGYLCIDRQAIGMNQDEIAIAVEAPLRTWQEKVSDILVRGAAGG